jgi:hypothetical protein
MVRARRWSGESSWKDKRSGQSVPTGAIVTLGKSEIVANVLTNIPPHANYAQRLPPVQVYDADNSRCSRRTGEERS